MVPSPASLRKTSSSITRLFGASTFQQDRDGVTLDAATAQAQQQQDKSGKSEKSDRNERGKRGENTKMQQIYLYASVLSQKFLRGLRPSIPPRGPTSWVGRRPTQIVGLRNPNHIKSNPCIRCGWSALP